MLGDSNGPTEAEIWPLPSVQSPADRVLWEFQVEANRSEELNPAKNGGALGPNWSLKAIKQANESQEDEENHR